MHFSAYRQATIEILQQHKLELLASFLKQYFKSRRYIGSKDRRNISDLVFSCYRHYFLLQSYCLELGVDFSSRNIVLLHELLITKLTLAQINSLAEHSYGIAPLSDAEQDMLYQAQHNLKLFSDDLLNIPAELIQSMKDVYQDRLHEVLSGLQGTSSGGEFRINSHKTSMANLKQQLQEAGYFVDTSFGDYKFKVLSASEYKNPINLKNEQMFKSGLFEVQSFASQLVVDAINHCQCKDLIWDYCSGAGGKSLIIADLFAQSQLISSDIYHVKLAENKARFKRAGYKLPQYIDFTKDSSNNFPEVDIMLVDAPCSGSGNWSQHPELKKNLLHDNLQTIMANQIAILNDAKNYVKENGYIIYMTCSILPNENIATVENFLGANNNFELVNFHEEKLANYYSYIKGKHGDITIVPNEAATHGFYIAIMKRIAN